MKYEFLHHYLCSSMAKPKAPKRTLKSYTVKSINKTIKPGDCVLMRPSDPSKSSNVAKIEGIESDARVSPDLVRVFHPTCINMTAEEAKRLDHFFCENCSTEGQKKLQNSHTTARHSDTKV